MFKRRLLINGIGGDSELLLKIKVINDTNGSPIPLAKVYVEGGTSSIQTTNTAGEVEWRGFKTGDVGKSFVVRVADSGTETCLNFTSSFQLRGLVNETLIVPLSNINNSAKCYLLHEKTLAPVNDSAIQIVDQSTTPVGIPNMNTVNGLAEWQGLTLDVGEYSFYYEDLPVTAISEPFAANLSTVQVIRYMFINPPLEGITVGEKPSGGVLGYSSGYYSGEPDQFGGIRPKKLQLTPSVQAEIDAVVLQQDQCTIVIDTVQMNENYMNAILTFKMAGLPDMLFAYAFNEMQYYIYTCASTDITEQWLTYWGANIGNTLPFELTSSLNSVLEIHVDEADGSHISAARVEIAYDGKSNVANTNNEGIALFINIPTGTEISYTITAAGYNAATGKWIIPTDVEHETEYVVLTKPLPASDTNLWATTAADEAGFYGTFDITIPAGVNVIYVGGVINGSIVGEPCYCSMFSSTKTWLSFSGEDSTGGTTYVGVTPLKTYRVTVDYSSEIDGTGGSAFIRYSQRINGVTPSVLDY